MKTYNVIWEERHKTTIEVENEADAITLAEAITFAGEGAQWEDTFDEIISGPEAYEVKE